MSNEAITVEQAEALSVIVKAAKQHAEFLEDMDDSHAAEVAEIDRAVEVVDEMRASRRG